MSQEPDREPRLKTTVEKVIELPVSEQLEWGVNRVFK